MPVGTHPFTCTDMVFMYYRRAPLCGSKVSDMYDQEIQLHSFLLFRTILTLPAYICWFCSWFGWCGDHYMAPSLGMVWTFVLKWLTWAISRLQRFAHSRVRDIRCPMIMPYQLCSSWTNPLARVQQRKTILMISEMLESQVGSEGYVHVWKSKYIYNYMNM